MNKSFYLLFLNIIIIFENHMVISTEWPDINDIDSISTFVEDIADYLGNESQMSNNVDDTEKKTILKDFAMHIRQILEDLDEKESFSWADFYKKLEYFRPDNSSLFEMPRIITNTIENHYSLIKNVTSNFTISNDDSTDLCSLVRNNTFDLLEWDYFYLRSLHDVLIFQTRKWIVKQNNTDRSDHNCEGNIIFLHDFYGLFETIIKANILKFIWSSFVLSLEYKCAMSSSTSSIYDERDAVIRNMTEFINTTKNHLADFPEYIYSCDTKKHIRDETFIELEGKYRTIIYNEKDINSEGSCAYNCDTKSMKLTSEINSNCAEFDCQYMGAKFDICELSNQSRKYQWIKDENKIVYGNNTNCEGKITELSSWYHFWTSRYCDYCVCACTTRSQKENKVRAINLQDQTSDTRNNRVIVNVRFVNKNNIIYIQIQEGTLLPKGRINTTSVFWKPVKEIYDLDDFAIYGSSQENRRSNDNLGYPEEINLDDLTTLNENYVVTGVRFQYTKNSLQSPKPSKRSIELQIRTTLFSYHTGELQNYHSWISSENQVQRNELLLIHPDNPIKSPKNNPNFEKNKFIKFQVSDFKTDAGQATVPYFDARSIESKVLLPLRGIGIFHHGSQGFGGFISFKISIVNPSEYLNSKLSKTTSNSSLWDAFFPLKWF